jgi:hypothetical protein
MYVFVLIALGAGAAWLFIERPLGPWPRALIRFGILSYACFALSSGIFWVCSPASTAQLVPGHSGGVLVATATQARGLVVIVLGLLSIACRKLPPAPAISALIGPLLYNLVMSAEAFAAQFTVLATPERWLYVALHFSWAACFAFGVREQRQPSTEAASHAARLTRSTFAVLAGLSGLYLFSVPYGFLTPTQPLVASSFLAHSLHGFGSACVALCGIAIVTTARRGVGLLALILAAAALAVLALSRAGDMGGLEPIVRLVALVCIVHVAAWLIERGISE